MKVQLQLINELCPNCVEKLKKQRKKLGKAKIWLVCPKCGYRKRPYEVFEIQKMGRFIDQLKENNSSNKFKEKS